MLAFCLFAGNLMWTVNAKKLHIVTCELHHIYNIEYEIGVSSATCPLTFWM
jgi:hypothetical protein